MTPPAVADPFGTAALRRAVLAAWTDSPARFREDANTEEDHARSYYRDRVVVELAQNAADAALLAGTPGELSLVLRTEDEVSWLEAHNTGAPLTTDGVQSLATMRASAKHRPVGRVGAGGTDGAGGTGQTGGADGTDGTNGAAGTDRSDDLDTAGGTGLIGRFGVGFAAVRSISDHITIASRTAPGARTEGVSFDLGAVHELLGEGLPAGLGREVAARGTDLPILRLPFPFTEASDAGETTSDDTHFTTTFTTTVRLRLRDADAARAVRGQLTELDDLLTVILPSLSTVSITIEGEPTRVLTHVPQEWRSIHATGDVPAALLADLPVEDRARTQWSVTWAARTTDGEARTADGNQNADGASAAAALFGSVTSPSSSVTAPRSAVLHAPTPTDEPCTVPATLIATFPLDPSRRHVAPGPVTDLILAEAAKAYVELVGQVARRGGPALEFVPAGMPAGSFDAQLREQILAGLRTVPLIPALSGPELPSGAEPSPDPLPSPEQPGPEQPGPEQPGPAQPGPEQPGPEQPGEQPGPEHPGPEHPGPALLLPSDANLLDGPLGAERHVVVELARFLADLTWVPSADRTAARLLGVQTRTLAEVIEALGSTDRRLLDVLGEQATTSGVLEALADLPVRLLDGRTVRGVRGVVLPAAERDDGALEVGQGDRGDAPAWAESHPLGSFAQWGLRVADPQQAHPLLLRLGAVPDDPATVLSLAPVTHAITELGALVETTTYPEDLEPEHTAALEAILRTVQDATHDATQNAATLAEDTRALLAGLPLLSEDGQLEAARDLSLPGSPAEVIFDGLIPVDESEVRWGADTLAALGVRTGVTVTRFADVVADDAEELVSSVEDDAQPDRWTEYLGHLAGHLGEGAYVGEIAVLADLDAVAADQWGEFLGLVMGDPEARAGLLDPVRGQPSYAAWWLREHFGAPFTAPGASTSFLPPTPDELRDAGPFEDSVWEALGAVSSLEQLRSTEWELVFQRLPEVGSGADLASARALWRAMATAAESDGDLPPAPERILALVGIEAQICDAGDVVVTGEPMWRQVSGTELAQAIVPVTGDADLLGEFLDVPVRSAGEPSVHVLDRGTSATSVLGDWILHDAPFRIGALGAGGPEPGGPKPEPGGPEPGGHDTVGGYPVEWWVTDSGELHALGPEQLALAYAQREGRWPERFAFAERLRSPDAAEQLAAEAAWD